MSLTLALNNAVSGLKAAQASLATISNNVSNANTVGYTRKYQNQSSAVSNGTGAGVNTPVVIRKVDELLRRDIRRESSTLGATNVRNNYYTQMQQLLGSTTSGGNLNASVNNLQKSLAALGATPSDSGLQENVVAAARNVALSLNRTAKGVQDLRQSAENEIKTSIDTINQNLQQVVTLNRQITRAFALGEPTGDLADQRDLAVSKIAEQMGIQTFTRDSGEMVVYSSTGRTLVDGQVNLIQYTPTNSVNASTTFGQIKLGPDNIVITNEFTSGRMQALMEMRDKTLPEITSQLNLMARGLYEKTWSPPFLPSSTAQGVDQTGQNPFAIISFGGNLPSTAPAGTSTGPISFNATVENGVVTNPSYALVDSAGNVYNATYELRKTSASSQWQVFLTSLTPAIPPTGNPTAVTQFTSPPPPAAATVTFAGGTVPPPGTNGGLSIGYVDTAAELNNNFINFQVQVANAPPTQLSMQIRSKPTDFTSTTAATNVEPRSETYRLFQGMDLSSTNANNAASIKVNPLFDSTVGGASSKLYLANDKTPPTAQRMANQFLTQLDTRQPPYNAYANALSGGIYTMQNYTTALVSTNSVQAKAAEDGNNYQSQYVTQLQTKSASIDGVSTDEELSNMILYQNAYQASAKVLETAQALFDVLMNLKR
ncbi:MAG: flagellar hook-associated protein FlgK [Elsteraceae bacterium]